MARLGDSTAIAWCMFTGAVPLDAVPGQGILAYATAAAPKPDGPREYDLAEAQERHVIAALKGAGSFRGISSDEWKKFFTVLPGCYRPPEKDQVARICKSLDARIDAKKSEVLKSRGPWGLLHDGAPNKGDIHI